MFTQRAGLEFEFDPAWETGNKVRRGRLGGETVALTHVDSVDTAVEAEWRKQAAGAAQTGS